MALQRPPEAVIPVLTGESITEQIKADFTGKFLLTDQRKFFNAQGVCFHSIATCGNYSSSAGLPSLSIWRNRMCLRPKEISNSSPGCKPICVV